MDTLDVARWQFGITTVYHFIFVPLDDRARAAGRDHADRWVRTGNERWLRLTKFFGKLLLINFAIGVATGIVQEFQFGMNWSEYSRFVGDVFGAPLAMEALAAFFVESTFLGLWIFGWDKLPKKVHLACIWAVALATNLSAFFILAANSWMQHPVGADLQRGDGPRRDERHRRRADQLHAAGPRSRTPSPPRSSPPARSSPASPPGGWSGWSARARPTRPATSTGPRSSSASIVMLVVGRRRRAHGRRAGQAHVRAAADEDGRRPRRCARPTDGAPFSHPGHRRPEQLAARASTTSSRSRASRRFLATGDFNAPLPGVNDLQAQYEEKYGFTDDDRRPDLLPAEPADHVLVASG